MDSAFDPSNTTSAIFVTDFYDHNERTYNETIDIDKVNGSDTGGVSVGWLSVEFSFYGAY